MTLTGHFIRYAYTIECNPVQQLCHIFDLYKVYNGQLLLKLSKRCSFSIKVVKLIPFSQCQLKLNISIFVKAGFMAELLYWIAVDFKAAPDKMATECNCFSTINSKSCKSSSIFLRRKGNTQIGGQFRTQL